MVLPVVVICILPFIYLLRMLLCQIVLERGVDECVKQMAIEIYVLDRVSVLPEYDEEEEKAEVDEEKAKQLQKLINEYTAFFEEEGWKDKLQEWGYELVGELLLQERLQKWLDTENLNAWGIKDGWDGITVSKSDFLYDEENHHYLIKGAISFEWETLFSFWKPKKITIQRVYHCFVGEKSISVTNNEENDGDDVVVYRIGEGVKYHSAGCYLINKNIYTSTKSQAEQQGKSPCDRCEPTQIITVYQTKGGDHYHTASCSYLKPDISSLKLEEAIQLGYTGCGLCQGGNHYFS